MIVSVKPLTGLHSTHDQEQTDLRQHSALSGSELGAPSLRCSEIRQAAQTAAVGFPLLEFPCVTGRITGECGGRAGWMGTGPAGLLFANAKRRGVIVG